MDGVTVYAYEVCDSVCVQKDDGLADGGLNSGNSRTFRGKHKNVYSVSSTWHDTSFGWLQKCSASKGEKHRISRGEEKINANQTNEKNTNAVPSESNKAKIYEHSININAKS